jgi:uncharacterized protein YqgQ
MSKKQRSHGEQMAIRGEMHALYKTIIMLQKEVAKLEVIIKKDEERESKNVKRRRTVKKD